ncbi:MAG: Two-component sensor histidine kinase [Labilithrix sp.]|jgi:signal transduction histidine kinase|nr:Two-component sensor histidine kinase [Labilithrix sp.]
MTTSIHPAASVSDSAARAHEQKNCLSIILAVASLVTPELSDGGRERMERLRAAAHRIRDLINADLDESGDGYSDVDVQRLFDAVCESLRDRAEAARVDLILECAGGRLRACEGELREALFNLISNAIEATPTQRSVFIHTETSIDGDHVWSIHDSGVGMRREVLEQIGTPHRSFRSGGSGLGVALARAIVNRHGGTLRFDSIRGRGTTVTICLPGTPANAASDDDDGCRTGSARHESF